MIAVTITNECLNESHSFCAKCDIPQGPNGVVVIGGWSCICSCHFPEYEPPSKVWVEEIKQRSIEARKKGNNY